MRRHLGTLFVLFISIYTLNSDCLRIDFVRERLHQRADIIAGFLDALFTLEPDDYGLVLIQAFHHFLSY